MSKSEYPPRTPQEKSKDPSERLTQEEVALLKEQNNARKQTESDATSAIDESAKQTASFGANNKVTFDQKLVSLDKNYDNDRVMIQREISEANKNNASKAEVEKIYNKLDTLESDYEKTRKSMMVRENVLGSQDNNELSLEDSIDQAMDSVAEKQLEKQIDTLTKEYVSLAATSKNTTPEERAKRQEEIMSELSVLRGEEKPDVVAEVGEEDGSENVMKVDSKGTVYPTEPGFKIETDSEESEKSDILAEEIDKKAAEVMGAIDEDRNKSESGQLDMQEFEKVFAEELEKPKGMRSLIREEYEAKQSFIEAERSLTKSSHSNPVAYVKSLFGKTDDDAQAVYDQAQNNLQHARSARMEARFNAMKEGRFKKILEGQEGGSTGERLLATLRRDSVKNETFDGIASASSNTKEVVNAVKYGSEKIRLNKVTAWYQKQPLWAKFSLVAVAAGTTAAVSGAGAIVVGASAAARGVGYFAGLFAGMKTAKVIDSKEQKKIDAVTGEINDVVNQLEISDFQNMEKLANAERKDLTKIQRRYLCYKIGGMVTAGFIAGGGAAGLVDNIDGVAGLNVDTADLSGSDNVTPDGSDTVPTKNTQIEQNPGTADDVYPESPEFSDQDMIDSDGSQDVPIQKPLGYYDFAKGDTVYDVVMERVIGEAPEMSHLSDIERQNLAMNFIAKLREIPDLSNALTGADSPDHIIAGDQIRLDGWRQLMVEDSIQLKERVIDWGLDRTGDGAGRFETMLDAADALDPNTVPTEVAGGYGPDGTMTYEEAQAYDAEHYGADVYENDSGVPSGSEQTSPNIDAGEIPQDIQDLAKDLQGKFDAIKDTITDPELATGIESNLKDIFDNIKNSSEIDAIRSMLDNTQEQIEQIIENDPVGAETEPTLDVDNFIAGIDANTSLVEVGKFIDATGQGVPFEKIQSQLVGIVQGPDNLQTTLDNLKNNFNVDEVYLTKSVETDEGVVFTFSTGPDISNSANVGFNASTGGEIEQLRVDNRSWLARLFG